jgi:predicted acetyltransferase
MQIDLPRASIHDAPILTNLFQYYVYDMSEVVETNFGADGRFVIRSLDGYWSDPWRHPHLVRVNGNLAGFALIQQRSRITGDEHTWDIAEFFVLRKYRRHGVGSTVATRVFDSFRGKWEVRELKTNHAAIAFWRRVVAGHTKGSFQEILLDEERWRGPVQSFQN